MAPSILRRVRLAFLGFGAVVATIFPFYANFFVEWKVGMLPWFILGCFIAGLFIGVANYWVMNWILISQLRRISLIASSIANKDLSATCSVQSDDTIGEIVSSFNCMVVTLRELISRTSELSSRVRSDSNDIRDQTMHIQESVGNMGSRSQEIHLAMQGLGSVITDITDRSADAAQRASKAGDIARDGVKVAQYSINGMQRISTQVSGATERVARLEKSTQEVGAIVVVIKEIADQTNLLALNAAIEAARAGEQGRGFAVVADEVRKLAEKTTDATSQIGKMIGTIQNETREAIVAISDSMNEAKGGVEHARLSGDALERIAVSVEEVVSLVREIAQAASGQGAAVNRVNDSVAEIQALNSGTLQDSDRGVNISVGLATQANQLDGAVKSFKL